LPKDDVALLWDMLDAARSVQRFASGRSRDDLDEDAAFRMAVERGLEIVGVAASRVSPSFRLDHAEISWQPIISQRNVIAHEYGDIILDEIWRVVTERIPELIILLEPLVPQEEPE
jgi:uncharacterized protein with HEPN domain